MLIGNDHRSAGLEPINRETLSASRSVDVPALKNVKNHPHDSAKKLYLKSRT
jgi:hypothetical protein